MRAILSLLLIPLLASAAPEKPPREPRCLAVEPATLRTALAKPIPGARLTVLIPAREDDLGLVHLSKEEFAATGLSWDRFRRDAEAAAARHLRSLTPIIQKNEAGDPLYATLRSKSHLTASTFFCKEFHVQFRKPFGDQLVVLAPDRFTLYIFPRNFSGFQEFGKRVIDEYQKSTWPCSLEAFEVSSEGVRGIGSFDDGSDSSPSSENLPPAASSNPPSPPTPSPASKPAPSPRVPKRTPKSSAPPNHSKK
ncbi:MAG: hypothetical protein DVB22_001952 [Verrucomicrobia bacterium]|jgi:hypothetical protein|nr:MAG: hypothetical protein DVB22_001952 [Verrucomicrobiota bacterium]